MVYFVFVFVFSPRNEYREIEDRDVCGPEQARAFVHCNTGSGTIGLPTAQSAKLAKLQQQSAQAAAYKYKYEYKLYL